MTIPQVVRVEHVLEVADDALAAVEQDRRRTPFDEIPGRRRVGVRGGGAATEDRQAQSLAERVRHARMLGAVEVVVCRQSGPVTIGRMRVGRPVTDAPRPIPFFAGSIPRRSSGSRPRALAGSGRARGDLPHRRPG